VRRLVTGSCDNSVRIWYNQSNKWEEEKKEENPHTGVHLIILGHLIVCLSSFLFPVRLGPRRCLGTQHGDALQLYRELLGRSNSVYLEASGEVGHLGPNANEEV
jgi:hypothetical protein